MGQRKSVVELLIGKGADVNAKDTMGSTLMNLSTSKEIKDLLRRSGGLTSKELRRAKGE